MVRQKNEYRMSVVTPFEWMTRWIVQTNLAGGGADEKTIHKTTSLVKFPWEGDKEEVTRDDILSAGGDPDDEFWWIETGDLSAVNKNEGKSIDNFKLNN